MSLEADFNYWESVILDTYGDKVSFLAKKKPLVKFGRNDDLDTGIEEMIWQHGGFEVLPTTDAITHLSSSNAGDTQLVRIEGHTIDGSGNLTFLVQTATLNGQNKVALTTPMARTTRIENKGSTDFLGTVYVYEDDTVTGGVWQTKYTNNIRGTASNFAEKLTVAIIVTPNSDVRVTGTATANNIIGDARISGFLAIKVD